MNNEKNDDKTKVLLSCVFQNHADKAIEILQSSCFNKYILKDVEGFSHPLPLYLLSVCNYILLNKSDWNDFFVPVVNRNKARCEKLLKYWHEACGYPLVTTMDFTPFAEHCAHYSDVSLEDLFDGSLDKLVEMGYNKDEVLLCYGVLTYNTAILEEQMRKKTNPDVYISGEVAPYNATANNVACYNALDVCDEFVSDLFDDNFFSEFWETEDQELEIDEYDIRNLLEGAAYTQLKKRLKAYVPFKQLN